MKHLDIVHMAAGCWVCGVSLFRIVLMWGCWTKLRCDGPIYLGLSLSSGLFAAAMYLSRAGDYEESGADDVTLGACLMLVATLLVAAGLIIGWKHFAEECDEAREKEERKSVAMVEVHRRVVSALREQRLGDSRHGFGSHPLPK